MSETDNFNVGYVLACANIVNLHNDPVIAANVLGELGVSWTDIKRMGLSDYDMAALRKIKREVGISPFIDGRKKLRKEARDD